MYSNYSAPLEKGFVPSRSDPSPYRTVRVATTGCRYGLHPALLATLSPLPLIFSSIKLVIMRSPSKNKCYCVCLLSWCGRKVNGKPTATKPKHSSSRLAVFPDDHLRDVVLKPLLHGATERDIQIVIDKKGDYRVASWHFKASDKFKSRGSGQNVMPRAVPLMSRRECEAKEQGQAPSRSSPRSGGPPAPRTSARAADHDGADAQAAGSTHSRDITDFDAGGMTQRELVSKAQDLAQHINVQRHLLDQARVARERKQRESEGRMLGAPQGLL